MSRYPYYYSTTSVEMVQKQLELLKSISIINRLNSIANGLTPRLNEMHDIFVLHNINYYNALSDYSKKYINKDASLNDIFLAVHTEIFYEYVNSTKLFIKFIDSCDNLDDILPFQLFHINLFSLAGLNPRFDQLSGYSRDKLSIKINRKIFELVMEKELKKIYSLDNSAIESLIHFFKGHQMSIEVITLENLLKLRKNSNIA